MREARALSGGNQHGTASAPRFVCSGLATMHGSGPAPDVANLPLELLKALRGHPHSAKCFLQAPPRGVVVPPYPQPPGETHLLRQRDFRTFRAEARFDMKPSVVFGEPA